MTTYEHAQRCHSGQIFTDREGNRAVYSDRSDGTRQAFGRLIWADGTLGNYGELPDNLYPERYNVTAAHDFAQRIKEFGFIVYLAASGHYGFISDESGERVISFSFDVENTLSGNYGPPSRESGTGWRLNETPDSIRTADDVRRVLYASPPDWCRRNGKGWKHFTTREQHLKTYGPSSKYRRVGGEPERKSLYQRGLGNYALIRDAASDPLQLAAEVTEDEYNEMLGCVPPMYVPGLSGFLVGEPITSDERGTVYANYFQSRDGLYCARYHVVAK